MKKLLVILSVGLFLFTNLFAQERRTPKTYHNARVIKHWTDKLYYNKTRYFTSFSITPTDGFIFLKDCGELILIVVKDGQRDNRIVQIIVGSLCAWKKDQSLYYYNSSTPFSSNFFVKRDGEYIESYEENGGIRIEGIDNQFFLKQLVKQGRSDYHLHIFRYE